MSRPLLRMWWLWTLLVWFVSFPWIGFTLEPQWHRVHWIPFSDPADRFRDILANILLFLPFGYFSIGSGRHVRSLIGAAALAACVSVSAEAMQVFSTKRHPSATDVTVAVSGALAGGLTALSLRASSRLRTWTD